MIEKYRKSADANIETKQKDYIEQQNMKRGKGAKRQESAAKSKQTAPASQPQRLTKLALPKDANKSTLIDKKDTSPEEEGRVIKAPVNLAAEGARLDNNKYKYSSEKGMKNFFSKRKENIRRV